MSRDESSVSPGSAPSGGVGNTPGHVMALLVIKNPSDSPSANPFQLTLPLNSTIGQLKARLEKEYPSKPASDRQKLIYSGQLLSNETDLESLLSGFDLASPQVFHLVVSRTFQQPSTYSDAADLSRAGPSNGTQSAERTSSATHSSPQPALPGAQNLHYGQHVGHGPNYAYPFPAGFGFPPGMQAGGYLGPRVPANAAVPDAVNGIPVAPGGLQPGQVSPFPGMAPTPYGFDPEAYAAYLAQLQHEIAEQLNGHHFNPEHGQNVQEQRYPAAAGGGREGGPGIGFNVAFAMERGVPGQAGHGVPPALEENRQGAPGADGAPRQGPWVRQYAFQFELNWSLISKLVFLIVLLGHEGSSQRIYTLMGAGIVVYLWQTGRLRLIHRRMVSMLPSPSDMFASMMTRREGSQSETDGAESSGTRHRIAGRGAFIAAYAYSFAYGFIFSLLPSWEPVLVPHLEEVWNMPVMSSNGEAEVNLAQNRDAVAEPGEERQHVD